MLTCRNTETGSVKMLEMVCQPFCQLYGDSSSRDRQRENEQKRWSRRRRGRWWRIRESLLQTFYISVLLPADDGSSTGGYECTMMSVMPVIKSITWSLWSLTGEDIFWQDLQHNTGTINKTCMNWTKCTSDVQDVQMLNIKDNKSNGTKDHLYTIYSI